MEGAVDGGAASSAALSLCDIVVERRVEEKKRERKKADWTDGAEREREGCKMCQKRGESQ